MPWYAGLTLVEGLNSPPCARRRRSASAFQQRAAPGREFSRLSGTVAGGSVKPGDSVMILPSGMVANVTKIVTFDLVRNAAVAGDAITLGSSSAVVDVARGDMIVSIDSQLQVGLSFDAQIVACSPRASIASATG